VANLDFQKGVSALLNSVSYSSARNKKKVSNFYNPSFLSTNLDFIFFSHN